MNLSEEVLFLTERRSFNTDIIDQVSSMKDDFLSRFIGVKKDDLPKFRKMFREWVAQRTQFKSLKNALLNFLPFFMARV